MPNLDTNPPISAKLFESLDFRDLYIFRQAVLNLANALPHRTGSPSDLAGETAIALLHEIEAGARARAAEGAEDMLLKILCTVDPNDSDQASAVAAEIACLLGIDPSGSTASL